MPKKPLSVTLADENLVWLRGRAAATKRRSLSAAIDEVLTAARTGGAGAAAARSVVGTIDIGSDDAGLEQADTYVRAMVADSIARPLLLRETAGSVRAARPRSGSRGRKTTPRG